MPSEFLLFPILANFNRAIPRLPVCLQAQGLAEDGTEGLYFSKREMTLPYFL